MQVGRYKAHLVALVELPDGLCKLDVGFAHDCDERLAYCRVSDQDLPSQKVASISSARHFCARQKECATYLVLCSRRVDTGVLFKPLDARFGAGESFCSLQRLGCLPPQPSQRFPVVSLVTPLMSSRMRALTVRSSASSLERIETRNATMPRPTR